MLMQWDNPGNLPSTVMGAAEGLGTNKPEEIELKGVPVEKVSRHFNRQDTVLCGKFKNVNVIVGSACEPGCRVMVRICLLYTSRIRQTDAGYGADSLLPSAYWYPG